MLETLDTIDWANVHEMFGDAADIPAAIRDLTSPDPDVREAAVERIDNHAVVEGALTEAAPLVVPFLIEIVAEPGAHGKSEALDLLFQLAGGHPRLSADSDAARAWASKHGVDLGEAVRLAEREHADTRRALLDRVPVLCEALASADPEVRLGAGYVLARLPEALAVIAEPLLDACEREADAERRAVLIECFGDLAEGHAVGVDRLERRMASPLGDVDRTAAASALALGMQQTTSEAAVDVLVQAMRATWPVRPPGPTAALTVAFPVRALLALGPTRGAQALARCLERPRNAHEAHRLARALLGLVFGERPLPIHFEDRRARPPRIEYTLSGPVAPPPLTEVQRRAIEAIHGCDAVWEIATNLFALFGLPGDRAALGQLARSS